MAMHRRNYLERLVCFVLIRFPAGKGVGKGGGFAFFQRLL